MKKPMIVNEDNIDKVVITDGKAYINIYKNKISDEYYIIDYRYNRKYLKPGEKYCNICGAIWNADSGHYHKCNEDLREIYRYNQIIPIIYDYLEDGMEVTIHLKDNSKLTFNL